MPYLDLSRKGTDAEGRTAKEVNSAKRPFWPPAHRNSKAPEPPVYIHLGQVPSSLLRPLQVRFQEGAASGGAIVSQLWRARKHALLLQASTRPAAAIKACTLLQ